MPAEESGKEKVEACKEAREDRKTDDEGCATDSTCATVSERVLDKKLTKEWQKKVGLEGEAKGVPVLTPRDPQRVRRVGKGKRKRKRFSFAEFFAGLAGLTIAISAVCEGLVDVWTPFDEINGGDFADDDQYAEMLRKSEAED